jgi:type IV fimbrial biogenesis protein FimT
MNDNFTGGCMSRQKGVTLIELMIAVGILAIVVAIAVPNFQSMIQNNRLTAAANEMLGTFQIARSEAVRTNRRVVLTLVASPDPAAGEGHVMVFVDDDRDGTLDAGERQVRTLLLSSDKLGISAVNGGGSAITSMGFQPDGRTVATGTMTAQVCDDRNRGQQLVLRASGQSRLTGAIACP